MNQKLNLLLYLVPFLFLGSAEQKFHNSNYIQRGDSFQNVIVVVIDGARYSETFGSGINIPKMYNELKPLGTVYSNFRIADEGITTTCPGHSSILTGTWQQINNEGMERPNKPTVFEYFRKEKGSSITENYVIGGKEKLKILSYSMDKSYETDYSASSNCANISDIMVYDTLLSVMNKYHPRLIMVNFSDVDLRSHDNNWNAYLNAIKVADSLVYLLWQKIQSDPFYIDRTTLFVTNDHGRHTVDFTSHGDDCDGCEHIMLLAVGKNFAGNIVDNRSHYQIDLCKTIGELMDFKTPQAKGTSLLEK